MRTTRSRSGGFTLLEVLVAIGVLTFVAVAIATIFDAIGDTLTRGKRISELNQFASRIESVMRKDFETMTRDGFLVIRHEYANGGQDIALFDGDADPKPRRVDQLMFFGAGEYSSSRRDIYAGLTPTSGEARIYYGHGQQRTRDYELDSPYLKPDIQDTMMGGTFGDYGARLGLESTPGLPNPNEYSADWSLLRHVTVLAPPISGLAQVIPDYTDGGIFGYGADRNEVLFRPSGTESKIGRRVVQDNPYQVALQPAITSIFWNAQEFFPSNDPDLSMGEFESLKNPVSVGYDNVSVLAKARFTSGLVDVATTSLAEIESVVTSAALEPNHVDADLFDRSRYLFRLSQNRKQEALDAPGPDSPGDNKRYPFSVTSAAQQRAWMINAMPTYPAELRGDVEIGDIFSGNNTRTSPRIRFETTPPNLAGTLSDATGTLNSVEKRLLNAYQSADQEMLSQSIFAPRCTQFIIEWTFGEVFDDYSDELLRQAPDPERAALTGGLADLKSNPESDARGRALWKKFVWYGRDGWAPAPDGGQVDLDGDGDRDYDPGDRTTFFYTRVSNENDEHLQSATNVEDAMDQHNADFRNEWKYPDQDFPIYIAAEQAKNPLHIVGREASVRPNDKLPNGRRRAETATFGYYVYDAGQFTQNEEDDLISNWPWPKLIRITFWLADPNDPGIETSYQVVFEVPSRDAG